MTDVENFVLKFTDFSKWDPRKQIDYFTYFLTVPDPKRCATVKDIKDLFLKLSIREYKRLPQYLSENSKDSKNGKYIRIGKAGYRLERRIFDEIGLLVRNEPTKVEVSTQLTDLIQQITNSNEKSFLVEAINCYRVEAYRAAIVMTWSLAIDHLQNYIFGNKLSEFNGELAKNPDRKISKIIKYDDFSDLSESKFIEIARASAIISNDVRKILDEKLGIRNSAAHPSGITFSGHKATEFILDLVSNILLKY